MTAPATKPASLAHICEYPMVANAKCSICGKPFADKVSVASSISMAIDAIIEGEHSDTKRIMEDDAVAALRAALPRAEAADALAEAAQQVITVANILGRKENTIRDLTAALRRYREGGQS